LAVWRGLEEIVLPTEIRNLLEATYCDTGADVPLPWQAFHRQLEDRKRKLAANAVTRIFANPSLNDDEGVQTRWEDFPSANLVLITRWQAAGTNGVQGITFLNGDTAEASDYKWSHAAAAAIHRNTVRVPLYAVADTLKDCPDWLKLHSRGRFVLGVINADTGDITVDTPSDKYALQYNTDIGVKLVKTKVADEAATCYDEYNEPRC